MAKPESRPHDSVLEEVVDRFRKKRRVYPRYLERNGNRLSV